MLKLKLQYFGHLMRRADSFEKTLTKVETKIIQAAGEDGLDWGGGRGFGEKRSDS